MVLERFKAFGRGKRRDQLESAERDILRRDVDAIRIVRIIYLEHVDWSNLDERQKLSYYRQMKDYLQNFPSHLASGDNTAVRIQDSLAAAGLLFTHALEGCEYALSLSSKKRDDRRGVLREVKKEKLIKTPRAAAAGRTRPAPEPAEDDRPEPPQPRPPPADEGRRDRGRHDHGGGGETGELCPVCGRMDKREMHTLRRIGQTDDGDPIYSCDHCGNHFRFHDSFMILITTHDIPHFIGEAFRFYCPVCRGWTPGHPEPDRTIRPEEDTEGSAQTVEIARYQDPTAGMIVRIRCRNHWCRAGLQVGDGAARPLQPWFIDLGERDYDHWRDVELRGPRLQTARLMAPGADIPMPGGGAVHLPDFHGLGRAARARLLQRQTAEIERIRRNLEERGITDVDHDRLGISEGDARRLGFDRNELNRLPREDREAFERDMRTRNEEEAARRARQNRDNLPFDGTTWPRRRLPRTRGMFRSITEHGIQSGFSIILALIGVVVGAVLGWPFLVAFTAWAGRNILPNPRPIRLADTERVEDPRLTDWEHNRLGSLWARGEDFDNRVSTGLFMTKTLLKILSIFFFGLGFFSTDLPFRGFLLIVFCFLAYFDLPGEYSSTEPQKFLEGMLRPGIALFFAFGVFWGIFRSMELAWITLAFFMVFPVAQERNVARAIGYAGSGVTSTAETFDKIIFGALMVICAFSVMLGGGLNLDLGTIFGNIFFPFWIIALLGGLTSPANVRPYTGVIMIILVFVFYTSTTGGQVVGQGFFGVWWPSVHNTVTSVTKPMVDVFANIGTTFGQTIMLITNPVGFSKQIIDGSYVKTGTAPPGAFGIEIESLEVPALYPGTFSMATFNIRNAGPVNAKNVVVTFNLPDSHKDIISVTDQTKRYAAIEPGMIEPLFFNMDASDCKKITASAWWSRQSARNEYVRVSVTVAYDYEVSSWMPLTIISEDEWRNRVSKGTFAPSKIGSFISTSPVKLSIGSFDQPLVAGNNRQFYIGFNMTPSEKGDIDWPSATFDMSFPAELGDKHTCIPPFIPGSYPPGGPFKWGMLNQRQAVICTFPSTPSPGADSETYYVRANARFRFIRTETKDTLFAFSDVCTSSPCEGLAESICSGRSDCMWTQVQPGTTVCTKKCEGMITDTECSDYMVSTGPSTIPSTGTKICKWLGTAGAGRCLGKCSLILDRQGCGARTDCAWRVAVPGGATESCTDV